MSVLFPQLLELGVKLAVRTKLQQDICETSYQISCCKPGKNHPTRMRSQIQAKVAFRVKSEIGALLGGGKCIRLVSGTKFKASLPFEQVKAGDRRLALSNAFVQAQKIKKSARFRNQIEANLVLRAKPCSKLALNRAKLRSHPEPGQVHLRLPARFIFRASENRFGTKFPALPCSQKKHLAWDQNLEPAPELTRNLQESCKLSAVGGITWFFKSVLKEPEHSSTRGTRIPKGWRALKVRE